MDIEQIMRDNKGLMYKQLHKFNLAYNEDAISYAMEALWNAAKTFNPNAGIKFSTYASTCIYNGIMMYFRVSEEKLDVTSYDEVNEDGLSLLDSLADIPVCDQKRIEQIYDLMYKVADTMTRESQVKLVYAWIDSNFEAKQRELAAQFDVTQAAVSRTLGIYKNKLKQELEDFYEKSGGYY